MSLWAWKDSFPHVQLLSFMNLEHGTWKNMDSYFVDEVSKAHYSALIM
jgi:hypothetical protein